MSPDRRRWSVLSLIACAALLVMTTWFSATAVVQQLTEHLQLSSSGRVWLTISVQLGFVAGAMCSAMLGWADRFSGRSLMVVGSLSVAAVNLLILWLDQALLVTVARFFTGFALAAVYPPAMKLIATWFATRRGVAMGILIGAIALGTATPHLVNALGGLAWEVVIICTSALAVVGALIVGLFVREGPYPYPRQPFNLPAAIRAFRNPSVTWVTVGYLGHMWELYAMWAWFAVFYQYVLSEAQIANSAILASASTFVVIGVGSIGCVFAGLTSDRFGRSTTAYWSLVISGSMAAVIGFLTGYPWLVLVLAVVWGLSIVADSAQFSALLTEVAQGEYVGSVLTLQVALGYLLTVPIIWLVPVVVQKAGWGVAFLMLSVGSIAGAYAMRRTRTLMHGAAVKPRGI